MGSSDSSRLSLKTTYHSTRQLIGRLECLPHGHFYIQYDLLDGIKLEFDEEGEAKLPFIPEPFPPVPTLSNWTKKGVQTRIRPYLFWAAMQLATLDENGRRHSVLISVMQGLEGYVEDFLELLDSIWPSAVQSPTFSFIAPPVEIPNFFSQPSPTDPAKYRLWQECLSTCIDYFGPDSAEYQLLEKGIVLHYGRMPGLLARILIQVIEQRIVNVVIATSTLSEGINLPFETILIPTLQRRGKYISVQEFSNLTGRAGRPGTGTEGRSFIVLPMPVEGDKKPSDILNVRRKYEDFLKKLQTQKGQNIAVSGTNLESPLAGLLSLLKQQWQKITKMDSDEEFMRWLELDFIQLVGITNGIDKGA